MGNLLDYAKHELDLIGMTEDAPDEINRMMRNHLLHMVEEFAKEGHSGMSASYALANLKLLLAFEPLSPLTGADDEWTQIEFGPDMKWQNKRCSRVFKRDDGTAYDSESRVFWEWVTGEDGEKFKSHYTSIDSRVDITFPYVPHTEYVERESGAEG